MPYVNIKLIDDGVSAEEKGELIRGVTKVISEVLGKNPASVWVTIDELDSDNWGVGGESITEKRKHGG